MSRAQTIGFSFQWLNPKWSTLISRLVNLNSVVSGYSSVYISVYNSVFSSVYIVYISVYIELYSEYRKLVVRGYQTTVVYRDNPQHCINQVLCCQVGC